MVIAHSNGGLLANCVQLTKNYLSLPGTTAWRWVDVPCVAVEARPLCEAECQLVTWYHDEDDDGFGTGLPVTRLRDGEPEIVRGPALVENMAGNAAGTGVQTSVRLSWQPSSNRSSRLKGRQSDSSSCSKRPASVKANRPPSGQSFPGCRSRCQVATLVQRSSRR